MKNVPQIFLSYAYEDRERVVEISKELSKAGYRTWMDVQNLQPGQDWDIEIKKALERSDFVLIFLSKNSIRKRGYLQKEIKSALQLRDYKPPGAIYIIPIMLGRVKVPDYLQDIQWLDLSDSNAWEKLLYALKEGEKRGSRNYEQLRKSVKDIKTPKKHIFVAMPFSDDLEDCYFYGIKVPVQNAGFNCIRVDKTSFTGDILTEIKQSIETASAVVALLDSANPNVSLEVGYAWGRKIPTILLIRNTSQLPFDLRGQKCLIYENIRGLEHSLSSELKELMDNGIIQ